MGVPIIQNVILAVGKGQLIKNVIFAAVLWLKSLTEIKIKLKNAVIPNVQMELNAV